MDKKISEIKNRLKGAVTIPADKSISHRAVIFSSLAKGKSIINNFSDGQDPMSSLSVFKALGVDIQFINKHTIEVNSKGTLIQPSNPLDCGNSGTTMRLVSGILAAQNFDSSLIGDESLSKRPMRRIIEPLELMGAKIFSNDGHAPLKIIGCKLNGIDYFSKLASAQVKSCILLAGMFAEGHTSFTEPFISRDHTERMLKFMGANISRTGNTVTLQKSILTPQTINICGDISSAAFFIAAGLLVPNSQIVLKNVGLNPTRTGIIDVVKRMGGNIKILNIKTISGEEVGDIQISGSELHGCEISGEIIPRLIDEIPIIAVMAALAKGTTTIKDAQDLRNKESDRIHAIATELKKIGADIEELNDGFIINGKSTFKGDAILDTYNDHRLAMSLYVAGLRCKKEICIKDFHWVGISFPDFEKLFESLK